MIEATEEFVLVQDADVLAWKPANSERLGGNVEMGLSLWPYLSI